MRYMDGEPSSVAMVGQIAARPVLAAFEALEGCVAFLPVFLGRDEFADVLADGVGARPPVQRLRGPVPVDDGAGQVGGDDRLPGGIEKLGLDVLEKLGVCARPADWSGCRHDRLSARGADN